MGLPLIYCVKWKSQEIGILANIWQTGGVGQHHFWTNSLIQAVFFWRLPSQSQSQWYDTTDCSIYFLYLQGMALHGTGFSRRLCATRMVSFAVFGSMVTTEMCRSSGNGTATHSLSGTPHWCLQEYMEATQDSVTRLIPSGCSMWVKETDNVTMENIDVINKTGIKRLSEVRIWKQDVPGGILEMKECVTRGINLGNHDLRSTDYQCRQQTIFLRFAGMGQVPSGCDCYVRW